LKISHLCPKVGIIEYELDEAVMIAALYPYFKALLEEEYVLVPK